MANNFFDEIKDINKLKLELENKAKNHRCYSFYCKSQYVEDTSKRGLYFRTSANWNDVIDATNIKSSTVVRLIKCFSFSISENIAMWMLYSGFDNKGARFIYSKNQISDVLKHNTPIEIGCRSKNGEELPKIICKEYKISLIDIAYTDLQVIDGKDRIFLKRSDNRSDYPADCFPFDFKNSKFPYYVKTYGWNYENECRMIIEINKENLPDYNDDNEYYTFLEVNNSRTTKIVRSPNYKDPLMEGEEYSKYKGKINWNLNDNKS